MTPHWVIWVCRSRAAATAPVKTTDTPKHNFRSSKMVFGCFTANQTQGPNIKILQTAAAMSDSVIKAGPVTRAQASKHNFKPSSLVLHGPLPSRSQRRRFCRPAVAMSGPLLKTAAAATTVDAPRHHFKPSKLVFGLSTTFQTSIRKGFNKQQQQTTVQFCAQDNTSNNHSWHPKYNFSPSRLCVGWSAAIPDLKLDGLDERQRRFLTFRSVSRNHGMRSFKVRNTQSSKKSLDQCPHTLAYGGSCAWNLASEP